MPPSAARSTNSCWRMPIRPSSRPGRPSWSTGWRQVPKLVDVASDSQQNGLSAYIDVDRDTAGRFGITPATIDNALYDAFGQRIVSTIFTQSNQYRVILEADPSLQPRSNRSTIYLPSAAAARCRCRRSPRSSSRPRRWRSAISASSRRRPSRSISRPAPRSATPVTRSRRPRRRSACRPASSPASRARPSPSSRR